MIKALGRDGYCCAVTGIYDWKSVVNNKELRERVPLDKRLVRVHCTHIIPESTNRDLETLDKVCVYSWLHSSLLNSEGWICINVLDHHKQFRLPAYCQGTEW